MVSSRIASIVFVLLGVDPILGDGFCYYVYYFVITGIFYYVYNVLGLPIQTALSCLVG